MIRVMAALIIMAQTAEASTDRHPNLQLMPPPPVETTPGCKCSTHPQNNLGSEKHDGPYKPAKKK